MNVNYVIEQLRKAIAYMKEGHPRKAADAIARAQSAIVVGGPSTLSEWDYERLATLLNEVGTAGPTIEEMRAVLGPCTLTPNCVGVDGHKGKCVIPTPGEIMRAEDAERKRIGGNDGYDDPPVIGGKTTCRNCGAEVTIRAGVIRPHRRLRSNTAGAKVCIYGGAAAHQKVDAIPGKSILKQEG